MQLGHLKLSGYGLLSTQGVQNRSQDRYVSQSEVMLQYMWDPGAPAACRAEIAPHLYFTPAEQRLRRTSDLENGGLLNNTQYAGAL